MHEINKNNARNVFKMHETEYQNNISTPGYYSYIIIPKNYIFK